MQGSPLLVSRTVNRTNLASIGLNRSEFCRVWTAGLNWGVASCEFKESVACWNTAVSAVTGASDDPPRRMIRLVGCNSCIPAAYNPLHKFLLPEAPTSSVGASEPSANFCWLIIAINLRSSCVFKSPSRSRWYSASVVWSAFVVLERPLSQHPHHSQIR